MKKTLALFLATLLVAMLMCGCGAEMEASKDIALDGSMGNGALMDESSLSSTVGSSETPQLENQKLVKKVWLDAETEELDPLLEAIDQRIRELSGYVEEREVYNGSGVSYRSRYADITIRIPVDSLDDFVEHVTQNANITSTNETSENITLSYVATQSRITALETEQTRLLELLAMAETMDDLLKIEKRLTEVRTELEEVTSQLRLYDNMVDYGTVYLNIQEVREYTVTEEPETVWERISTGFVSSVKNVWEILQELFVFLVVASPYLVTLAVIAAVNILVILLVAKLVIAIIKRRNKKKAQKKQ